MVWCVFINVRYCCLFLNSLICCRKKMLDFGDIIGIFIKRVGMFIWFFFFGYESRVWELCLILIDGNEWIVILEKLGILLWCCVCFDLDWC